MKKYRILVAGAGIGGLTAASCLAKAGHHVEIYEQAPQLAEIGAGIQISANAMHVLRDLGLEQAIVGVGVQPRRLRVPAARHRRGDPALLAVRGARAPARRALHAAAPRRPARHAGRASARGRSGRRAAQSPRSTGFTESDDGVEAALRGRHIGARRPADRRRRAEVGGARARSSATCRRPTPATPRGALVVPTERLPPDLLEQVMSVFMGPGGHVVCYYLRGGALLNFVGLVETDEVSEESWTVKLPWDKLKAHYRGLASDRSRPSSTPPTRTSAIAGRCSTAADRATGARSASRCSATARIATLPYLAQGAAMAIEDGAVLTRALGMSETDSRGAAALSAQPRSSAPRGSSMQSNVNRKLFHLRSRGRDPRAPSPSATRATTATTGSIRTIR